MRFLWPEALWLLLLIPLLVAAYVIALRRRKRGAVRYASLLLVRDSIGKAQRLRRHVPPALLLVALTAAILALARPTASVVLPSQYMTIAMAMDVSLSMRATDVEPSRLIAAQNAAKAFIDELPNNVRLGIVSFAGTAAVVQTPTENKQDMIQAIDRFQLQRATATGSGLILALSMLFPEDGLDIESVAMSMRQSGVSLDQARKQDAQRPPREPVAPGSYTWGSSSCSRMGAAPLAPTRSRSRNWPRTAACASTPSASARFRARRSGSRTTRSTSASMKTR